jgi:hypothetical protein
VFALDCHIISDQLCGDGGKGHAEVRAAVHGWLVDNEELRGLSGFVAYDRMHLKEGDWAGYVEKLATSSVCPVVSTNTVCLCQLRYVGKLAKDGRKGGMWGDHLCLTAAAGVWGRPIIVFSTEEGRDTTIEPPHGCEQQPAASGASGVAHAGIIDALRVAHLPEVHYRSVVSRASV